MKNIYLIPTDKPSKLATHYEKMRLIQTPDMWTYEFTKQNIYITSDEKFVRDEYITDGIEVIKATPKLVNAQGLVNRRNWRKVILTTDQDLIKDGVQAIDDEFLEWFVKNPSCDKVVVTPYLKDIINSLTNEKYPVIQHRHFDETKMICTYDYELIIPKEEPKQETLEEVAEKYATNHGMMAYVFPEKKESFIQGAKWQQERSYSEEEVVKLLIKFNQEIQEVENVREWFEEFKKK
jgi:hypothetical protein